MSIARVCSVVLVALACVQPRQAAVAEVFITTDGRLIRLPKLECNPVLPPLHAPEPMKPEPRQAIKFFVTGGCEPCERMKPRFYALMSELSDRFTYEEFADRASAWHEHVSEYPTIVVYEDGVETKRLVGEANQDTLRRFLLSPPPKTEPVRAAAVVALTQATPTRVAASDQGWSAPALPVTRVRPQTWYGNS